MCYVETFGPGLIVSVRLRRRRIRTADVRCWTERGFSYAWVGEGREEDEMFLSDDLDVDVLVVVFVKGGCGLGVADPEVDGFGVLVECYTGPGNVFLDVREEMSVFVAEVVVFWREC